MAQEFSDGQYQTLNKEVQEEMKELIRRLNLKGVDFVVEGNKILIKCDIVRVDLDGRPPRGVNFSPPEEEIVISQEGKKVYISLGTVFHIWISFGNEAIGLHNHIHVEYKDSYLIIEF